MKITADPGIPHLPQGYQQTDAERIARENYPRRRPGRGVFARDRARIIHSAALRRLAAKTQVYSPQRDDFVRNRLTHTLEVAQIGREIAAVLGCDSDVVDAACLSHDLGHPPFGHYGETILDEISAGIGGFEGNAQTFRILTRLEAKRTHADGSSAGLNLCRAVLDASMKYPWARGQLSDTKKFGFYPDDAPTAHWVRKNAPAAAQKCLEAQIMDWADDVAYSVHDIEDGISAGAIDLTELRQDATAEKVLVTAQETYGSNLPVAVVESAWEHLIGMVLPKKYNASRAHKAALKDMTSNLIGRFAAGAQENTLHDYGHAPLTRYGANLRVPTSIRAEVEVLKSIAHVLIFLGPERVSLEYREERVLRTLVEYYLEHPGDIDADLRDDAYNAPTEDERLRIVIDAVSSLTDGRAHMLCRRLEEYGRLH